MALGGIDDMHEFRADSIAIGVLKGLMDFSKRGIGFAYMETTRLENSVEVSR